MSRAIKHLLIGGLVIMTMGVPTATTANENLKLTIVNPQGLYDPAPNGYSHAVIASGGGRIAYIAGQGGEDSTGTLSPDFAVQVEQAYANLRTAQTLVPVPRLALDSMLFEVEAVAVLD